MTCMAAAACLRKVIAMKISKYTVTIEYVAEQQYTAIEATNSNDAAMLGMQEFKHEHPHVNSFLSTVAIRED